MTDLFRGDTIVTGWGSKLHSHLLIELSPLCDPPLIRCWQQCFLWLFPPPAAVRGYFQLPGAMLSLWFFLFFLIFLLSRPDLPVSNQHCRSVADSYPVSVQPLCCMLMIGVNGGSLFFYPVLSTVCSVEFLQNYRTFSGRGIPFCLYSDWQQLCKPSGVRYFFFFFFPFPAVQQSVIWKEAIWSTMYLF